MQQVQQEKRGSPVVVAILGLVLLALGLYIGGWFNVVKPAQVTQCEAQVRLAFPRADDQQALLPKCTNRHMIEGMNGPGPSGLSVQQILDNLDAGRRLDVIALFLGGGFMGGGIAAFAAAHRIHQRKKRIAVK